MFLSMRDWIMGWLVGGIEMTSRSGISRKFWIAKGSVSTTSGGRGGGRIGEKFNVWLNIDGRVCVVEGGEI